MKMSDDETSKDKNTDDPASGPAADQIADAIQLATHSFGDPCLSDDQLDSLCDTVFSQAVRTTIADKKGEAR